MGILIIVLTVLVSAAAVVFAVVRHSRKTEMLRCRVAAANLIREELLNYSLNNPLNKSGADAPCETRCMIYIKTINAVKKQKFVFIADKTVSVGRDAEQSNVYINDNSVSKKHCLIFARNNEVYIKDLGSNNGFCVQRGLFGSYQIGSGETIRLKDNDTLIICSAELKIKLFCFNINDL
ncbi:MAG: FHA domain-containing protein [Ruminococcus sp.]|nr:FHA domain-containing protein [Ruminococcus sp.]